MKWRSVLAEALARDRKIIFQFAEMPMVRVILFCVFVFLGLESSNASAVVDPSGPPYALLIGVSDYRAAGLPSLSGPANDVRAVEDALTTRFGIPPQNIKMLVDSNATHRSIERAFKELAQKVGKDSRVFIYYSGHGSTAKDPSDWRGEDQTWVPFGARSKKSQGIDQYDILDKEIAVWLAPIYAATSNVVFVSDSCHSATVSKDGVALGIRFAPTDERVHPLLSSLPHIPAPKTGIRIGAARDFESAVEFNPKTGGPCDSSKSCNGIFTLYWTNVLRRSRLEDGWRDVFNRASALISSQRGITQSPQIEGQSDRAIWSSGETFPHEASVAVRAVNVKDRTATLNAGLTSLVTVGSQYKLFSSQDGFSPASLQVITVGTFSCTAKITSGNLKAGDLVAEVSHNYTEAPTKFFVAADYMNLDDKTFVNMIKSSISKISGAVIVDEKARADVWVQVARRPDVKSGDATRSDLTVLAGEPAIGESRRIWVLTREGVLINPNLKLEASDESAADLLTEELRKYLHAQEMERLYAQGNSLPVSVGVSILPSSTGGSSGATGANDTPPHQSDQGTEPGAMKPIEESPLPHLGETIQFYIQNKSQDTEYYTYVFAIGPNSEIQCIQPSKNEDPDDARVSAGQSFIATNKYKLDEPGTETILTIVSDTPFDPLLLTQAGYNGAQTKGTSSQLEQLIQHTNRAKGDVVVDVKSWGVLMRKYQIAQNPG